MADPWEKAVLAACLAILLALAHSVQESNSGVDALKGSRLFLVSIISLSVAELPVRAGNRAELVVMPGKYTMLLHPGAFFLS